jgi:hypothetical protein
MIQYHESAFFINPFPEGADRMTLEIETWEEACEKLGYEGEPSKATQRYVGGYNTSY